MRINKIVLYNFGSYVGENTFDTKMNEDRNIILVGGKNGAGKTTLFTAMRLCLYGHMSFGYQNINSYYNRSVTKLINSNAKMKKPTPASVTMQITLNNGQELDYYELCRSWILSDFLQSKALSRVRLRFVLYPRGKSAQKCVASPPRRWCCRCF